MTARAPLPDLIAALGQIADQEQRQIVSDAIADLIADILESAPMRRAIHGAAACVALRNAARVADATHHARLHDQYVARTTAAERSADLDADRQT